MIPRSVICLLVASSSMTWAQQVSVQPPVPLPLALQVPTGRPWLGLKLTPANPSTSAHIPSLPPGIGFVISSIDPVGPAQAAKLQPFDLLWKMGDQMLVNEAQLATLLGLHKPGDEVTFAVFRAGKPLDVRLKLGDLPAGSDGFSSDLAEAAILPSDGSPMRVVTFAERTATYSSEEGKAVLRKDGEGYFLVISNPANEVIFKGDVSTKETMETLPEGWQRRVWSLKRGLDHGAQDRMLPVRPPRPRVVPPPAPAPTPGS